MAAYRKNYFSKTRVETFSDGVFAIIVTLLVLEIKVPEIENHLSKKELIRALIGLLPKVLSWIVSFLIVCVIWVNHHRIFEQIKIVTHALFWLNANLLLWCSFIPFPTAAMGDYINNPVSLCTFGIILSLMALSFSLIRFNAIKNKFVLNDDVDDIYFKKTTTKSIIFGPVLYMAGALCSFIHPYISLGIYFFIPLYFIFNNSAKSKKV
ncbi:MAG: DUF1211 domain-containing protein [Bacteroidetes bacterium]|nr:DUF1211 domain-containing protein [Bacteroidota bacterium]